MSGWIKLDKALIDTIKFRRVVRAVTKSNALRGVTDATESFGVAVVLGALMRLWVYADTHIADDDTLAITLDEIDDLVGVQGFAQALPAEWLQVIDADHVKLPDFLEHNGSSEKLRRNNARRQAAYRHRHKQQNVTRDVTTSNTRNDARPDQTRPEETRPDTHKSARATPRETKSGKPEAEPAQDRTVHAIAGVPRETLDAQWQEHHDWALRTLRPVYPSNLYTDADWLHAARVIAGRLTAGTVTREQLLRYVTEFAAQQDAQGRRDTQYVENPIRHYDGRGRWKGPFPIPKAVVTPLRETAADKFDRELDAYRRGSSGDQRIIEAEVINGD